MNVSPRSKSLDAQINDYLLNASGHLKESKTHIDGRQVAAFGAAASSALAMMSQAEAAVVHTTPGAVPTVSPPAWGYVVGSGSSAAIDLNNDANADFQLYGYGGAYSSFSFTFGSSYNGRPYYSTIVSSREAFAGLKRNGSNQVIGGGGFLNKLSSGNTIGPAQSWTGASPAKAVSQTYYGARVGHGGWSGGAGETGFAGVQFDIGGQTHYGWIRLQLGSNPGQITATEWAYEDCPDTPITAGATTGGANCAAPVPVAPKSIPVMGPLAYGLTSLALGGLGLGSLRRRRRDARKAEANRS
jgi:hypothetical protein